MNNTKKRSSVIILGVNDALVEITGTLVGLAFALQNGQLVGIVGMIMGVAASLSMAASEFLSSEEESKRSVALINSLYTGIAYFSTVILLVLPYFIFSSLQTAIIAMIINGIFVIALYSSYSSRIHKKKFHEKFFEILLVSSSVAFISFIIGILIRTYLNVDI